MSTQHDHWRTIALPDSAAVPKNMADSGGTPMFERIRKALPLYRSPYRRAGQALFALGWLSWTLALILPAFLYVGLGAGRLTVAMGYECLMYAIHPVLWFIDFRFFLLLLANLIAMLSPIPFVLNVRRCCRPFRLCLTCGCVFPTG
jgi:hypothetical protein